MEICLSQCQICQALVAQSMCLLFSHDIHCGGTSMSDTTNVYAQLIWVCFRLQCLKQPWPTWSNYCLGHFGWIINTCSLQRCWLLFSQSVLMCCHKFNLSAITHRCQFKIKLQALHNQHHQASPACAMSTPETCGCLMPGAPCRSQPWLPQPVPHSQQRGLMNGRFVFSPEESSGWAQAPEIPAMGRKQASASGWSHILCCLN